MSLFTIQEAKFNRWLSQSPNFAIATISVSVEDLKTIMYFISQNERLEKSLNALNTPRLRNVSIKSFNKDFCSLNIPNNTPLKLEVEKIEFNPKYNSFSLLISEGEEMENSDEEKIFSFLKDFVTHVGEKKAKRMMDFFGWENIEHIFENDPNKLLAMPEIKEIQLKDMVDSWKKNRFVFQLKDKCATLKVSKAAINRAINEFGAKAYEMLCKPYHMTCYKNANGKPVHILSWNEAESIVLPKGIEINESVRLSAALRLAYNELANDSGSTLVPMKDLINHVFIKFLKKKTPIIDITKQLLKSSVLEKDYPNKQQAFIRIKAEVVEDNPKDKDAYYLTSIDDYRLEKFIADKLALFVAAGKNKAKLKTSTVENFRNSETWLDDSQKNAVLNALTNNVVIVTGGPGTGKTTSIHEMFKQFNAAGLSCMFTAPTGKASQKIAESVKQDAMTLHRAFKITPDDVENEGIECTVNLNYKHDDNEDEPIEPDVLFIDESSMLSNSLMAKVLSKLNPLKTSLVFIGDVHQLPPIERGNFLRDIIDSDIIPCSRLSVLHRIDSNSLVASNAEKMRNRQPCDIYTTNDFEFIPAKNDIEIQDIILNIHNELKSKSISQMDIQCLTPQSTTIIGVNDLNDALREIMNPLSMNRGKMLFTIGDKVMQLKNDAERGVFNGIVGEVVDFDEVQNMTIVKFGERDLVDPSLNKSSSVPYEKDNLIELTLAYAMTIHKSQGSDYPYLIVPLSPSHRMWTRSLLYTALTRTKKKIYFIGDKNYLTNPKFLPEDKQRKTNLKRFLESYKKELEADELVLPEGF